MSRIYRYRITGNNVIDGSIQSTKPIENCESLDTNLSSVFVEGSTIYRVSNTFVLDWNGTTYRFKTLEGAINELRRLKTTL